jgi:ABC-type polar amino acid transport system ATPase subunit
MDEGAEVESGDPGTVLSNPQNPRTQKFLEAVVHL